MTQEEKIDALLSDFWYEHIVDEMGFVKEIEGKTFMFVAIKYATITARMLDCTQESFMSMAAVAMNNGNELFEENRKVGIVTEAKYDN